ncbi:S8 family serine peptidase [Kribbella sp. NPDC006257]|uniref:S8 family peptidase n=1 Tax=Kribbella sp. NPDC006257 TaxID=3156738 RepID=UPI0033AD75C0
MAKAQAFHRANVMLTSEAALARLAELEQRDDGHGVAVLNDLLESDGRGRPLYAGEPLPSGRVMLPVTGYVPAVVDAVRERFGADLGDLLSDFQVDPGFRVATWDDYAYWRPAHTNGCRTGHAWGTWEYVDYTPPAPVWRSDIDPADRPVVALLDNGVLSHPWLDTDPADPFLLQGSCWEPPPAWGQGEPARFGTHHGHGTFTAGLIRQYAPDATLLSIKVIDDNGEGYEADVIQALEWLAGRISAGQRIDVVCMPFGRLPMDDLDEAPLLAKALKALPPQIQLVASAGNEPGRVRFFPAALPSVIAVKALDDDGNLASYSSDGPWVTAQEKGTQVSTMPLDEQPVVRSRRFARWSGTSFAAAVHAATLAQARLGPQVP